MSTLGFTCLNAEGREGRGGGVPVPVLGGPDCGRGRPGGEVGLPTPGEGRKGGF